MYPKEAKNVASVMYELPYLQSSIDLLEDYLLSADIYWSIGIKPPAGEAPYPMLTLGGVLLFRLKASCRDLDYYNQVLLGRISDQINATHLRWRVAWENKSTREFHSRLMLWRDYLGEYRRSPNNNAGRYNYEVNRRVILDLLASEAVGTPSTEKELLAALDRFLKGVFIAGDFIWEDECADAFLPKETYWYLWGKLRGG
jgi:hypothetical protein